MDPITQQILLASAGAGGAGEYVDDLFSTFLYTGTGNAKTITNGIDLAGEGGLVWLKSRSLNESNILGDTETGITKRHSSNSTVGQAVSNMITSANSDGFTLGTSNVTNTNNSTNVSWTFRKQKGFFDIVTYTGNESNPRQIAHNLGSVPGMIIVKNLNFGDWLVYHRSLNNGSNPGNYRLRLNNTNATENGTSTFGATATSTHFTISTNCNYANNYVAYIFAHDDASFGTTGNESIIKCGSYTGTGQLQEIDLGFEPQWVMIKNASRSNNPAAHWAIFDSMRGMFNLQDGPYLKANEVYVAGSGKVGVTATGLVMDEPSVPIGVSGDTYIYMAIRRPHKPLDAFDPPLDATDVFAVDTKGGTSPNPPTFNSGFPVDWSLYRNVYGSHYWLSSARLMGNKYVDTASTNAQNTFSTNLLTYDRMDGMGTNTGSSIAFVNWMFKRAPGFFDVVMYDGSHPSIQNVVHNLGVAPEFIMIKATTQQRDWATYVAPLGTNKYIKLNTTDAPATSTSMWNNTAPTSSVFTLGNNQEVNSGGHKYIAYLFATLPGISKIGTYAGSNNTVNVDCGFTNGARFVMIRRIDNGAYGWNTATGWYIWDTKRGIVSGDDPYIYLNSSGAQTTGTDYIDPLSTGFSLRGSSNNVNDNGRSYFFLAIA